MASEALGRNSRTLGSPGQLNVVQTRQREQLLAEINDQLDKMRTDAQGFSSSPQDPLKTAVQINAAQHNIPLKVRATAGDGCELALGSSLCLDYRTFKESPVAQEFFTHAKLRVTIDVLGPTIADIEQAAQEAGSSAEIREPNFLIGDIFKRVVDTNLGMSTQVRMRIYSRLGQQIEEVLNEQMRKAGDFAGYFFTMEPELPLESGGNTFRLYSTQFQSFDRFDTRLMLQLAEKVVAEASKILDNDDAVRGWMQDIISSADFQSASSEASGDEIKTSASLEDKSAKKPKRMLNSSKTAMSAPILGRSNPYGSVGHPRIRARVPAALASAESSTERAASLTTLFNLPGPTQSVRVRLLQDPLNNFISGIALLRQAIQAFLDKQVPDPLVGENACHIRAAFYCLMAENQQLIKELQEFLQTLEVRKVSCIDTTEFDKAAQTKTRSSLQELLGDRNIQIPLQLLDPIQKIFYGYLLTITKQSQCVVKERALTLDEFSNPYLPGLTQSFAVKLLKIARHTLSRASIAYLRTLAPTTMQHLIVLGDSLGIQTAPFLPVLKILMSEMKQRGIPIVLRPHTYINGKLLLITTVIFTPRDRQYHAITEGETLHSQMAFYVDGVSNVHCSPEKMVSLITKLGVETILLAGAAMHPQYGGRQKRQESAPTQERNYYKGVALQFGLCAENPRLFQFYHIFAGKL